MPRIRTIKPEFWQDEKLVGLPDAHRLIFLGLVSLADDAGRLLDKPVKIEADLFDGESDRRRDVVEALANLSRIGVIRRGFTASGQRIVEVTNWKRHQRVDHPNMAAAFPEIVRLLEVADIREPFANGSRRDREALAHHTNDQRPVPTTSTNDRGPASRARGEELVDDGVVAHAVQLAAAANHAIAARFGNAFNPLIATSGPTHVAVQKLAAAAVPLAFACDHIGRHPLASLDKPPRALGYFVPSTIEQWDAHTARMAMGETARPPQQDVAEVQDRFLAIRFAREGDPEWQTVCRAHGWEWELAA
jgi:hypothetical protein